MTFVIFRSVSWFFNIAVVQIHFTNLIIVIVAINYTLPAGWACRNFTIAMLARTFRVAQDGLHGYCSGPVHTPYLAQVLAIPHFALFTASHDVDLMWTWGWSLRGHVLNWSIKILVTFMKTWELHHDSYLSGISLGCAESWYVTSLYVHYISLLVCGPAYANAKTTEHHCNLKPCVHPLDS